MDIKNKELVSILFDPNKENKEFKCDICYKYLSVTPILFNKTVGKICGRCVQDKVMKNSVGIHFERQILFEEISKHIHFPCSYQSKGCNEEFERKSVAEHEEICPFRKEKCMFGNNCLKLTGKTCKWTGNSKELIVHLKEDHNEHFQEFPSVNMSFMTDFADRIILTQFMGIVFACLIHVNNDLESLFIHVLMDTSSNPCMDYVYDFEVSDEESKNKLYFPGNEVNPLCNKAVTEVFLKTGLDVHIPSLGTQLKSSRFEFSFSIKTNRPDLLEANCKPSKKDNLIFDQKCMKCKRILLTPIYVCYGSHNICNICYDSGRCVCQEKISSYRNEFLEKLSKISLYNCENKGSGCEELLDHRGLPEHERNCKLTVKQCIMGCDFKGNNFEILQHVKEKHLPIDLKAEHFFEVTKHTEKILCAVFEENIFVLKIAYNHRELLSVSVKYLATQSGSFQFEFSIFSGYSNLKCTSFCYPIMYGDEEGKEEAIVYPFNFLKQFLTDQSNFFFKINIFRTPKSEKRSAKKVTSY